MRNETIAIHAGYDPDPTTKSVAVPIYQTVAYAFDSADHGAALFNLEAEGYRYSRIANPTTAVLEKRITELEGGVGALAVATGQAALHFALVNLADTGGNIVSVPQLYGTTHTLLSPHPAAPGHHHPLRRQRQGRRDREADRREHQGGVLRDHRQSRRQCLRHRGAGQGRASPRRAAAWSTTPSPRRSC